MHTLIFEQTITKMKNKNHILLSLLLIFLTSFVNAQCPTASFQLADTICAGQTILPINNSAGANPLYYQWDTDNGDLNNIPSGSFAGNFAGGLTASLGIDYASIDDSIFGVSITNSGVMTVFTFGTDINNTPTSTMYSNLGGIQGGWDLDIIKDGNDWIVFIAGLFNNVIYRVNFGSSFSNTPVVSTLSSPSFNWPAGIKAVYDQGNCYILTVNLVGANLCVIELGSSFQNSISTIGTIPIGSADPFGISVIKECNNWYGYVNYFSNPVVSRIEFGPTISSTPIGYTPNAFNLAYGTRKSFTIKDGNDWYLFLCSANKNAITKINLGPSAMNANPSITDLGSFGIYTSNFATNMHKIGSEFYGISSNFDTGDLIRFHFSQPNSGFIYQDSIPTLTFENPGFYHVSLTAYDSISNTTSSYVDSIFVKTIPTPSFTSIQGCEQNAISLFDNDTITSPSIISQLWDFGDSNLGNGDTVSHAYTFSGNYWVTLTTTNSLGCTTTYSDSISIFPNPVAGFSFTNLQCSNLPITYTDTSSISQGSIQSWLWDFGNGTTSMLQSPTTNYITDGSFTISLMVTSDQGCKDSISNMNNLTESPRAKFKIYNTCIGETTQFINETTFSGVGTINYDWDLDNGTTSTLVDPTHSYPAIPANYLITLIAESPNGCTDTLVKNISVGSRPTPLFTNSPDTACVGNLISFQNQSTPAAGDTIINWIWNFGDGSIDTLSINPTHLYLNPGTYQVILTAISPTYCDSSFTKTVVAQASPEANFSFTNSCFGLTDSLIDLSTAPTGNSIDSWLWMFGDDSISTAQNPLHDYSQAGVYSITLQVISSLGCTDTISQQIIKYEKPIANFVSSKACTGYNIQFNDSSTIASGNITSWNWDFGIVGNTSTLQNPISIYNSPFVYPVNFICTSDFGCKDTIIKLLSILQSPEFSVTSNNPCFGINANLQYQPVAGSSTNSSFLWNLGDSTSSFNSNVTHIYQNPNTYNYSLLVTDLNNGCSHTELDSIVVHPNPIANFSNGNICIGQPITFSDSSSISLGAITTWTWQSSQGNVSSQQNPVFTFPLATPSIIKLNVMSDQGCKDSISQSVIVHSLPIVQFTPSIIYGAPPLAVNFQNNSSQGFYLWTFDDNGSTSNLAQPTFIYSDTGVYNPSLMVVDSFGCTNSNTQSIYVLIPRPDLAIIGASFININQKWNIKAIISNTGNEDAQTFELKAQLDGESIFFETFQSDTLKAGNTREYTFNTKIAKKSTSPGYLCIDVISINNKDDSNTNNNHFCITNTKTFEILNVYPNPFQDALFTGINMPTDGEILIDIFDLLGRKCDETQLFVLKEGYNTIQLKTPNLTSAVYILQIRNGEIEENIRLLKK